MSSSATPLVSALDQATPKTLGRQREGGGERAGSRGQKCTEGGGFPLVPSGFESSSFLEGWNSVAERVVKHQE